MGSILRPLSADEKVKCVLKYGQDGKQFNYVVTLSFRCIDHERKHEFLVPSGFLVVGALNEEWNQVDQAGWVLYEWLCASHRTHKQGDLKESDFLAFVATWKKTTLLIWPECQNFFRQIDWHSHFTPKPKMFPDLYYDAGNMNIFISVE